MKCLFLVCWPFFLKQFTGHVHRRFSETLPSQRGWFQSQVVCLFLGGSLDHQDHGAGIDLYLTKCYVYPKAKNYLGGLVLNAKCRQVSEMIVQGGADGASIWPISWLLCTPYEANGRFQLIKFYSATHSATTHYIILHRLNVWQFGFSDISAILGINPCQSISCFSVTKLASIRCSSLCCVSIAFANLVMVTSGLRSIRLAETWPEHISLVSSETTNYVRWPGVIQRRFSRNLWHSDYWKENKVQAGLQ